MDAENHKKKRRDSEAASTEAMSVSTEAMGERAYVRLFRRLATTQQGGAALSTPSPMQPQPLLGVLAHPALDDRVDRLRRRLHVDAALAVARRRNFLGKLDAKSMIGQADYARAVDRALEMARQSRHHGIGLAPPSEELDLHPVIVKLVDQDADVQPALERGGHRARCSDPGRDQVSHVGRADLAHRGGNVADIGRAKKDRGFEAVSRGGQCRQLPVGEMGGKYERRLAVVAQSPEAIDRLGCNLDAARGGVIEIAVPQAVEMRVLGRQSSEIVPYATQDLLDLGRRFFRKGGGEVGAADAMLGKERPDAAHEGGAAIGDAVRIGAPDRLEQPYGEPAGSRIDDRLQS